MKKSNFMLFIFSFVFSYFSLIHAQVPQAMNYQAVARNASGVILSNQTIGIEISITNGNSGSVIYKERHTPITNQFGLFSISVGNGTVTVGSFAAINWGSVNAWMNVAMDPTGGSSYTNMGSSQLLSVPYALNATTSSDNKWTMNGNEIYSNNSGNVGIGIATPDQKLHVMGSIKMEDGNEGYGKVMTSDAIGTGSWQSLPANVTVNSGFRVYPPSTQTVTSGVSTQIVWTEEYDDANAFSGNSYTAPATGVYHFDVNIYGSCNNGGLGPAYYQVITMKKYGSDYISNRGHGLQNSTTQLSFTISSDVKLNAGDVITIWIQENTTLDMYLIPSSIYCSFTGHRVY